MNVYQFESARDFARKVEGTIIHFNDEGMPVLDPHTRVDDWMRFALAGLWSMTNPLRAKVCFNGNMHLAFVGFQKKIQKGTTVLIEEYVWDGRDRELSDFAKPVGYRDENNTIEWWSHHFEEILRRARMEIQRLSNVARCAAELAAQKEQRFLAYVPETPRDASS